jgi:hypothetical protein
MIKTTNNAAAALGELYKEFEARGLEVFSELTMQAADDAEEYEASTNISVLSLEPPTN